MVRPKFTPQLERRVMRQLGNDAAPCIVLPEGMYRDDGAILIYRDGLAIRLHRYLYQQTIGPLEAKVYLLQRCRTQGCVNPTHYVLSRRPQRGRTANHCPNGHEYTAANTLPRGSRRRCRICRDAYNARRRQTEMRNGWCRSGRHKLTPKNTYGPYANGRRRCRPCTIEASRERRGTA